MGINSPRIAGKPFVQRRHILEQPVLNVPANPGESFPILGPNGTPTTATYDPSYEGQIYSNIIVNGSTRLAYLYVAVDISGTLTWKRTDSLSRVNGYTGQAFDPMYD